MTEAELALTVVGEADGLDLELDPDFEVEDGLVTRVVELPDVADPDPVPCGGERPAPPVAIAPAPVEVAVRDEAVAVRLPVALLEEEPLEEEPLEEEEEDEMSLHERS
jgi:hypothetical protein